TECEDEEQDADEGEADFRHGHEKGELESEMAADLEDGEIVIVKPVVEACLRQHGEDTDQRQPAHPEDGRHADRDRSGIGIEQQIKGAEGVAERLDEMHLTALTRTARHSVEGERAGNQRAPLVEHLSRGRVQEGRRSAAHCLATGWKPAAKIYVVKPLGLVSFGTPIRLLARVAVVLDWQRESAQEAASGRLPRRFLPKVPYNYCLATPALDMLPPIGAK